MEDKKFTREDTAELAGHLTGVYVEALEGLEDKGLRYPDLVFASLVALKGIGLMMCEDEKGVCEDLRQIVEAALDANVVGKRFKTQADMATWLAEQGRKPDGSPDKPEGPVH